MGVKNPNHIKYILVDTKIDSGKYFKIMEINLSYEKKMKALPRKNPKNITNILIITENNEMAKE